MIVSPHPHITSALQFLPWPPLAGLFRAHSHRNFSVLSRFADRMQMWLAFIQLAAGAGEWAKHRKARTGMFAHPDKIKVGDQQLLEMYATINRRSVHA